MTDKNDTTIIESNISSESRREIPSEVQEKVEQSLTELHKTLITQGDVVIGSSREEYTEGLTEAKRIAKERAQKEDLPVLDEIEATSKKRMDNANEKYDRATTLLRVSGDKVMEKSEAGVSGTTA